MRAYRFFFGVSAGAAIALLTGTTATAQPNVGTPDASTLPASEATTSGPLRLSISEGGDAPEVTETIEVPAGTTSQLTPPAPITPPAPATSSEAAGADVEDLQRERSPNPLFFPTQGEEVRVGGVTPVSLDRAQEIAYRNSSDLREARQILTRSAFALQEQLAAEFPTLDLNANLSRLTAPNVGGAPIGGVVAFVQGQLQLAYNLFTGGQRPAQIRLAEEQLERDRLQVEVIAEQLRLDVSTAYYEVQRADSQVEIANAAIADAEQSLKDAQLLEEAGLGTRFDVLQAEVRLADEQQNLRDAIANQNIARRDLTQTLGLSQATAEVTAEGPPIEAGNWDMPLEDSIVLALRNRAELEQLLTDVAIAEESRTIARALVRPQVGLFAQFQTQETFDDGAGLEDSLTLQAQATWRLFDGGAARAQARQEEQNIAIAETNFSQQRNQVRFEVEQSFFNLQAERENIDTAKRGIEQAEESLRLARLRFQAGVGTQTDVINAQSELTSARGNLLNAIVDYNISLANLERSVSNLPDSELFDLP